MATTIPEEYVGEASLTPEKIEQIKTWYKEVLGDSDKATEMEAHEYYGGGVDMALNILCLLYGCLSDTPHPHVEKVD